ncbi:MAG: sulfatase-like hydrolase/transferase, partial [Myxococcota bacterium]|nr:sulfatase-like hydrolase/transferase [Myxococcota bacterium]
MMRFVAISCSCGVAAALFVAVATLCLAPTATLASLALEWFFLLPWAVGAALGLLLVRTALPLRLRPAFLLRAAVEKSSPAETAAVLSIGLCALALFPAAYRVVHLGMTKFHNLELASLLVVCALLALVVFLGMAGLVLYRLFHMGLERLDALARPWLAALLVLGAWSSALLPPLLQGPPAKGAFGFVGLLRLDGLGATPLIASLGVIVLCGLAQLATLERARGKAVLVTGALCLALSLSSPLLVVRLASNDAARFGVERAGGLGATLLVQGRRLSDRDKDGHGTLFGGKDCDDAQPSIHPGAKDVPDNGVDEDCSGKDLLLAELRAVASPSSIANENQPDLARPAIPADASLLLITVDAWRADSAGFMGYFRPTTPNIDDLAARGTVYERAYALASFTGHSVPAMMCGKWTSELKRNSHHEIRVSKDETFAAELICKEGVRCGAFVPHFLFKPAYRWNQGFADWEVVHGEAVPGEPSDEENVHNRTSAASLTSKAISWLRNPDNTKGRFWLWVHYFEPHREYLEHPGVPSFGQDRRAMYDHEVLFTDGFVGQLLQTLQSIGATERTVVVMTGDHGEGFLEHGSYTHGKELWEELLRVPMVVVGPGIANKRIVRPTSHIDVFPTLLELFGVAIPQGVHGRSLLPDWVLGQQLPVRPIVADQPRTPYFEMRRSYAEGDFKLIDSAQTGTRHLYLWTGE